MARCFNVLTRTPSFFLSFHAGSNKNKCTWTQMHTVRLGISKKIILIWKALIARTLECHNGLLKIFVQPSCQMQSKSTMRSKRYVHINGTMQCENGKLYCQVGNTVMPPYTWLFVALYWMFKRIRTGAAKLLTYTTWRSWHIHLIHLTQQVHIERDTSYGLTILSVQNVDVGLSNFYTVLKKWVFLPLQNVHWVLSTFDHLHCQRSIVYIFFWQKMDFGSSSPGPRHNNDPGRWGNCEDATEWGHHGEADFSYYDAELHHR